MKKALTSAGIICGTVVITWVGLTLWVEMKGASRLEKIVSSQDSLQALLIYDPDPIYNFDEQLCRSMGKGLADQQISSTIATVSAAQVLDVKHYEIIVICANTYNWAPDAAITEFVKTHSLKDKPVVAVTIGSGSTEASARRLKELLNERGIHVINQHEWWLMKPNDESRLKEKNIAVANDQAFAYGQHIAFQVKEFETNRQP